MTIVGYSYGTILAIELARKLEALGLKCQLILIDGSPKYLKNALETIFRNKNEDFEDQFLLTVMSSMFAQNVEKVK